MSGPMLHFAEAQAAFDMPSRRIRPIGRHLVETGAITEAQLVHALNMQARCDVPLGDILQSEGLITEDMLADALSAQHGMHRIRLDNDPGGTDLAEHVDPRIWLRHRVVPWMQLGPALVVATARPDRLEDVRRDASLPDGPLLGVIATESEILRAISQRYGASLGRGAERRAPLALSCRSWAGAQPLHLVRTWVLIFMALAAVSVAPSLVFAVVCLFAVVSLALITGLKLAAFCAHVLIRGEDRTERPLLAETDPPGRLPIVSMMIPLFEETEVALALIDRLARLTYPRALLDLVLVLEERDMRTLDTLSRTELPDWIRVVSVPGDGGLATKPRALNYALDFCRGDIVGVWDAEDAPAPDQIDRVVRRFAEAPPETVCLQGQLDFYNNRASWMARCFTIEYATWWRVVLPGVARLGLVVPLGGTTLFFRRQVLEDLGAWDAHNVTEDADLGLRLARAGYRTELIDTTTHEEANDRAWPWIRQRSRWLKGFMVTWMVHMRQPTQLMSDLGVWRFLGVQVLFFCTVMQFLLAPVLWSFWLLPLGLDHPVQAVLPDASFYWIVGIFVVTETVGLLVALVAVSGPAHRHLMIWVPTTLLYFPLGFAAAFKGALELFHKPFFWDKTTHGVTTVPEHAATVAADP